MDDVLLLSRLQFAMTVAFHFIFPPISIGLAWLLTCLEWRSWKKNDIAAGNLARWVGYFFAVTFAVGVATGITMEFQFGMNWSRYSKYVGDIFGAPLAAEGIFAFFLESVFLGVYLFGRKKLPKFWHWFSILMVSIGATISAFWIIVANSWQQTPAGFKFNEAMGRAELTSFFDAVFNPSTLPRFFHTVAACIAVGGFFLAGAAAYRMLKNKQEAEAQIGLRTGLITAFVFSVLIAFPFGDWHAKQVARTQPEKFATMEGLIEGRKQAPLLAFGIPRENPSRIDYAIEIPYMASFMVHGDKDAYVPGINDFPEDEVPPFTLTFVSFHTMVGLGALMIGISALGLFLMWKRKLQDNPLFLKALVVMIPIPTIAMQLGWMTAEVGRQPWVVYKLLKTSDAFSPTVGAGEVLASMILFGVIYLLLGGIWLFLLAKGFKTPPNSYQKEVSQ
jgi:cytochrome d ubiquinol oxidase subunit I